MAHEGDYQMEKMLLVEFEAAGFRTLGDEKAVKTPEEAVNAAFILGRVFACQFGGGMVVRDPSRDGAKVRMVVPERFYDILEQQCFVGKEYPDQVKSTLKILPPG